MKTSLLSKFVAVLWPVNLRYQLVLLSSLVLLATITVYTVYFANELIKQAQISTEREVVALAQNIDVASTSGVVSGNVAEIDNLLVLAVGMSNISSLRIIDAQGTDVEPCSQDTKRPSRSTV